MLMLLKNRYKHTLLSIFNSVDRPIEVWAYSSRVAGGAHDGSDLNLVIRTKNHEKVPLAMLRNLKKQICDTTIPILVELFDWERLPPAFHENILENYEVLFSSFSKIASEEQGRYSKN